MTDPETTTDDLNRQASDTEGQVPTPDPVPDSGKSGDDDDTKG